MARVLSVRKDNESVGREVTDLGTDEDRCPSRLVILIHGYQTSEERAARAYSRFAEQLRAETRGGERRLGAIWEFHWPGDHPVKPVSVGTFDNKIMSARVSGELLARRWLRRRRRDQKIVIVAHSLGCRVALEAVRWILDEGEDFEGARVEALFLLAAAVPVRLCDVGESFSIAHERSIEHVFFSRSDRVLQLAFDTGAYLAGEGGPAVGRDGNPADRWHGRHDTALGHGDYWNSQEVARRVVTALGVNEQHGLPVRRLPTWEPFPRRSSRSRQLLRHVVEGRRVA